MTASRKTAREFLDAQISYLTGGFRLDDLADTALVMNALDHLEGAIEVGLSDQEHRVAAREWAVDILESEGFPFGGF